jgi:hypothetical protein
VTRIDLISGPVPKRCRPSLSLSLSLCCVGDRGIDRGVAVTAKYATPCSLSRVARDARPAGGTGRLRSGQLARAVDVGSRAIPPSQVETPMSDNTTERNSSGNGGNPPRDSMARRLPFVAHALRNSGITSVIVSYRGSIMGVLFVSATGDFVFPSNATMASLQIVGVLRAVLRQRYPATFTHTASSGVFEWDLGQDTLRHEHTVAHQGL